jgi:GDP-L-fucose synthase
MKVLITGGSGFIGKNIVDQISNRYSIYAPSHEDLDLLKEQEVERYLIKQDIDVIIHSAIKPGHRNVIDTSNISKNNIRMFFNLARNLTQNQKMIFLSSGCVYDMRYYDRKMKEEYFDKHVPVDDVGLSKYVAAKYSEKVNNIVELRIFGVFGKYEDYAIRFISNAMCKALFDMPITIKQNRKFDYLYINDLIPVIEYFVHNDAQHTAYNVTPDRSIELYTLAEKVKRISGKRIPIKVAHEGIGAEYSGDNTRLKNEITSLRFTPIDAAMEELYGWYRNNKEKINRDSLLVDK